MSVSVWIFGDASQPAQDSLFYADGTSNGTGNRVLNAHAPWSDPVVYLDCGGYGAGQRASSPCRIRPSGADSGTTTPLRRETGLCKSGSTVRC